MSAKRQLLPLYTLRPEVFSLQFFIFLFALIVLSLFYTCIIAYDKVRYLLKTSMAKGEAYNVLLLHYRIPDLNLTSLLAGYWQD